MINSNVYPVVAKNVSDKQASTSIDNGIRFIERCLEDLIISGIYEKRRNIAESSGWSREKAFFGPPLCNNGVYADIALAYTSLCDWLK